MNEDNADQEDGAEQGEQFSSEEIASQRKGESQQPYPAESYPDDDVERQIERLGLYIKAEWSKLDFFRRFEVLVGSITLVALIIYAAYTIGIYGANRESADAAKVGADAAKSAATTASQALTNSIDNFQRDERPWVVIKLMEFAVTKQDKGYTISGDVVIVNNGKSPAWDMHVEKAGTQMNYGQLDVDKWTATHPTDKMLKIVTDSVIMGSGDTATIPFKELPVSQQFGDDILSHKLWVYTFGDVHYTDSFGYPHLTRYCGLWNPKTMRYDFCPNHTYVDRDK